MGWVVNATPPVAVRPAEIPVAIVHETEWAPMAGLNGCGKSRCHRDSIPVSSSP